ncbi:MAG TPA: C39 family peptidase [Thermoanaerobaculia bacterium]|nr:C39 family peptidase [Thermoanaerobaculia bacterium]
MALTNRQTAPRIAGLEVNSLLAAGVLPPSRFQETRLSASPTPIHDLNGELLFYRVPILRGRVTDSYADVAAFPVFGGLLLRVATGLSWDEKALLKAAETAARKQKRSLKFDKTRFVAYSYPKVAVQFLLGDEEVAMLELGSWTQVPPARQRKADEPPSNFDRWSVIDEFPPLRQRESEKVLTERLRQWEELKISIDPRTIDATAYLRAVDAILAVRTETRQIAYSPIPGDHVPCFELRGQRTNVWCVAASVQMILDFYRYNYDQTRLATELGLGTLSNPNGLPYTDDNKVVTTLETMTANALDASMNTSPSWTQFRDEIRANRPLISFVPGHSRAVAGYTATRTLLWNTFRGLLVYDPWPPADGVITQWENFDATTYRRTFSAQVTLVP